MSSAVSTMIRAQSLTGRKVFDATGKKVGRVFDLEVEDRDDQLCVTALRVGVKSLLARFGWGTEQHGRRIPWEHIASFSPDIRLRSNAGR